MPRVSSEEYNLSVIHPHLVKDWHPYKNGTLTPRDVTPYSDKRVWWLCEKGHEWQVSVSNRVHFQTGCPYCSGMKVCLDNCLELLAPHVASQWHPKKNGGQSPKDVTCGSAKKFWWICKKGHEWEARVCNRTRGTGCPYCAGKMNPLTHSLATVAPEIATQWHPWKNGKLTPKDVTPGSPKTVWWICDKGHEWQAKVANRKRGTGCPYCAGKKSYHDNCLETFDPSIASQWHQTRNGHLTPRNVTRYSNKKVWWQCSNGHEWKAIIANRTAKGYGCPVCSQERRRSRRVKTERV